MNDTSKYIQRLLEGKGISIGNRHITLFDDFVNESLNIDAVKQIFLNQEQIMYNWELKTKIQDIKEYNFKIPNGTVGKQYSASLDFKVQELSNIIYTEITHFSLDGLNYDNETETISGLPKLSGDFKIELKFRVKGEKENSELHTKLIPIIINPDPKSLWKNIPSDDKDPYWKTDNLSDFQPLGHKSIVVSSKRGRSHANVGSFRDDDFSFKFYENSGWSIVSVADGAGAAKYSRKGSQISCRSILNFFDNFLNENNAQIIDQLLLENFSIIDEISKDGNSPVNSLSDDDLANENDHQGADISDASNLENATTKESSSSRLSKYIYGMMANAAQFVHNQLSEFALENDMILKDLHSTLIFSLFKKYDFGYVILSFGVGDCPIGVINTDETDFKLMNWLDVGEYGGGTRFITMPEIFSSEKFYTRISLKVFEDFSFLFLMTDGIYDPKFVVEANLEKLECWKDFIKDLKGENDEKTKVEFDKSNFEIADQLSNWMDFWSSGNHDDRTLAIIF
jgi:serine/threonine protein phosphatase PrpC